MVGQVVLIVGIVISTLLLGRITTSARSIAFRRLFLIAFLAAAVVAILFPRLVQWVANLLGIGRGTDLLLYVLVIVFVGSMASNSRKGIETARRTTLLARAVALEQAESNYTDPRSANTEASPN